MGRPRLTPVNATKLVVLALLFVVYELVSTVLFYNSDLVFGAFAGLASFAFFWRLGLLDRFLEP
jgi:hypothetical protein